MYTIYTIHLQCIIYTLQLVACPVQCTMYNVQPVVYIVHVLSITKLHGSMARRSQNPRKK